MLFLTKTSGAAYVNTKEISTGLGESHHFVAKVLHQLAAGGLLHSYRGPNGGVALVRKADNIALMDIIAVIDGPKTLKQCILGRSECSVENPCPMHHEWEPVKSQMLNMMTNRSLRQIADHSITEYDANHVEKSSDAGPVDIK